MDKLFVCVSLVFLIHSVTVKVRKELLSEFVINRVLRY
jgi:hypothetical protein